VLVMPSNSTGTWVREAVAKYPGRLGHLIGPGGWRTPLPDYALDNGRFSVWRKGLEWDERAFWALCDKAAAHLIRPRWVVVPDVVAEPDATFRWWAEWAPRLRKNFPAWKLALAVQDGMTAELVRAHTDPDLVFVGGTDRFKWGTLGHWCGHFARVHVGRVNAYHRLWECWQAGAESVDGTGLGRTTRQRDGMLLFLQEQAAGKRRNPSIPFDLFLGGAA
jgi:hypothetical protein